MKRILLLWLFLPLFFSYPVYAATPYSQKPEVQQFISEMVTKHNFDQQKLVTIFDQVQPNPHIIDIISAPHEGLPWYRYRTLFVKQERAQLGAKFWQEHASVLATAEKKYGVPPQAILAILGVETDYGNFLGKYRVIDALSTLAFYYPPRASYFRSELEQFLLLTRENSLDPLKVVGSYAGAIGQPQFMPSSYRHYSVDTANKGYSDLMSDDNDAIMSVANYFKAYGWQNGQPVAIPARVEGKRFSALRFEALLGPPKNKMTIAQLKQYGVYPTQAVAEDQRASLLPLQGKEGLEFWLVFHNFAVIMRYNTSAHYAMAVDQLGGLIKRDYLKQRA